MTTNCERCGRVKHASLCKPYDAASRGTSVPITHPALEAITVQRAAINVDTFSLPGCSIPVEIRWPKFAEMSEHDQAALGTWLSMIGGKILRAYPGVGSIVRPASPTPGGLGDGVPK